MRRAIDAGRLRRRGGSVDKTDMTQVVVETPYRAAWRLVALGVVMTGASLSVALMSGAGVLRIVGAAGVLVFGLCLVHVLIRVIRRMPALVLTEQGFTDHSSGLAVGFVPWEEITGIEVVNPEGRLYVAVTLNRPSPILERQPRWKKILAGLNRHLVVGEVLIPQSILPTGAEELARTMREWATRHGAIALGPAPTGNLPGREQPD